MTDWLGKVARVKYLPTLLKGTSNDANPTPGYVLRDIAKLSNESPQTCAYIEDYLLDKLKSSSSPHVKLKVLKIMKYVSENGNPNFKYDLRRQTQPIRDCTSFSGPPDALLGSSPYVSVRDAAKSLLDALFSEEEVVRSRIAVDHQSSNALASTSETSYSSDSAQGSGSKMWGYGNPHARQPPKEKTFVDRFNDKMSDIAQGVQSLAKSTSRSSGRDTSYVTGKSTSFISPESTYLSKPAVYTPTTMGAGSWGIKSSQSVARDGNNDDDDDVQLPSSSGRDEWLQEKNLVDALTAPGGIRAAPPKDKLAHFLDRCKSLNIDKIFESLQEKLQMDGVPQVQLKALFVVEALLNYSNLADVEEYVMGLESDLMVLRESGQPSAKAKANKILCQLNPSEETAEPSQRKTSFESKQASSSLPAIDVETLITPEETTKNASTSSALFQGMTVEPATTESEPESQAVSEGAATLFGGMSLKSSSNPAPGADPTSESVDDALGFDFLRHQTAAAELAPQQEVSLMSNLDADQFDPLKGGSVSRQPEPATQQRLPDPLVALTTQPAQFGQPGGMQPRVMVTPEMYAAQLPRRTWAASPGSGLAASHVAVTQSTSMGSLNASMSGRATGTSMVRRTSADSASADGFGFVSKSSRAGAFDFVQDAMKESLKKN